MIRHLLQNEEISYIELNLLGNKNASEAFNTSKNADELLLKLTSLGFNTSSSSTVFFIDEIQEAIDALTPIKFLVERSQNRFIFSGSLLGVKLKSIKFVGIGYLLTLKMFPMDFEVFYFNSKKQGEIDFVVEKNEKTIPIEVKSRKIYLPIYMLMFITNTYEIKEQIYIPDISSLK